MRKGIIFLVVLGMVALWLGQAAEVRAGCCQGIRGDDAAAPPDGAADVSDMQVIIDYVFFEGELWCFEEADVNADGVVDMSDVQDMIDFIFFSLIWPVGMPCPPEG